MKIYGNFYDEFYKNHLDKLVEFAEFTKSYAMNKINSHTATNPNDDVGNYFVISNV